MSWLPIAIVGCVCIVNVTMAFSSASCYDISSYVGIKGAISAASTQYLRNKINNHHTFGSNLRMKATDHNNEPSEEDKAKGKKLADAWIRQDKASECAQILKGKSIFLVGPFDKARKPVGQLLAKRLTYRFLDIVEIISAATEKPECSTAGELIDALGDGEFRKFEEAVMDQMQPMVRCVIATADEGTLSRPMNWIRMQQGVTVYLQREGDAAEQQENAEASSVSQLRVKTRSDEAVDDQVLRVIQGLLDQSKRPQQAP